MQKAAAWDTECVNTSIILASGPEEQISVVFELHKRKYFIPAACIKAASPLFSFLF